MYTNPVENSNIEFSGNYSKFKFIKVNGANMYKIMSNGAYLNSSMATYAPVTISKGTEDRALLFMVTRVSDNIINVATVGRVLDIVNGKLVTSPLYTPESANAPIQFYITGTN